MKKLLATAAVLLMAAAPGNARPTVIGVSMALFDDNFLTGVRQAGCSPKDVFVRGVDATADALAEMQKGGLAVTVFQDAKDQRRKGIENAVRLARGEKVEQPDFVPYELVTPENCKTFLNR